MILEENDRYNRFLSLRNKLEDLKDFEELVDYSDYLGYEGFSLHLQIPTSKSLSELKQFKNELESCFEQMGFTKRFYSFTLNDMSLHYDLYF